MMIVLIWVTWTLLWSGCHADTDFSWLTNISCDKGFCIFLSEPITAEAGLCTVIPCFFREGYGFTPHNMVWFKCEQTKPKCVDSDMILHPNKNKKTQLSFRGRVSLLEPDARQRNCSIAINDLTVSDSGSYQLRVNGLSSRGKQDGFSFPLRATVTVKALSQKPTVTIPPLTEGRRTTLTCTAPGLCSGSVPKFTWTWRGRGEDVSYITGNITDYITENLTSIAQKHTSTLTFNPSAKHHNSNITCEVSFSNITATEETVTLTVNYVKEVKITGDTSVKEKETLNLTCSVESFPPSVMTWTKVTGKCMQNGTEATLQGDTGIDLQNNTGTCLQEEGSMGILSISDVSPEHAGPYICTAKYLNNTLMKKVHVAVTYMRTLTITGDRVVVEGAALNLTCGVDSVPLSRVTWSLPSPNATLHGERTAGLQSSTGSVTLWISNVTREHSGRYDCTARYLDRPVTVSADVTVTSFPKILQSSGCRVQAEVLTCVCVSEGLPLPTIGWPLLKNLSEYQVITTVSELTVNSTAVLNGKQLGNSVIECTSSNENGQAAQSLDICPDASPREDQTRGDIIIYWLEIIIAFLIGVLLSAFICCLVTKYHRIKLRSFGNLEETVEMVTNQEDQLIAAGQAAEEEVQTYYRDIAEERSRAVAPTKAATDDDAEPGDLEYASIDFSVLKRKREMLKKRETAVTEYAEIKVTKEEGGMLEGKENEVMMGGDEDMADERCCTLREEVDDVYSTPKDVKE